MNKCLAPESQYDKLITKMFSQKYVSYQIVKSLIINYSILPIFIVNGEK